MKEPLYIQEALRAGTPVGSLIDTYHLEVRQHGIYPNLLQFKYDQLESDLKDPLVRQCRGLILDATDDWKVVCRGFDKFFNYGESGADEIEWSLARVQEKLDGSLIMLYWYGGQWNVATSGTPDGACSVNGNPFSFSELFWKVWEIKGWEPIKEGYRRFTLMFELTTAFNQIVVKHPEPNIHVIGMRNNESGSEWPIANLRWWNPVRTFPLNSIEQVLGTLDTLQPHEQEGYVIVDHFFNRVKVKAPQYVALHHLRGNGLNPKRITEIVQKGEVEEIVSHFPEWADPIGEVKALWDRKIIEIADVWEEFKGFNDRKEFALAVKHLPYFDVLFALKDGRVQSVTEYLKGMQVDHLMNLLGVQRGLPSGLPIPSIQGE